MTSSLALIKATNRTRKIARQLRTLRLQEIQLWFTVPTWGLTALCKSSFREILRPLLAPHQHCMHTVYVQCRQNTHVHKKNSKHFKLKKNQPATSVDTTSDSVPPGFSRSLPGCLGSRCEALSSECDSTAGVVTCVRQDWAHRHPWLNCGELIRFGCHIQGPFSHLRISGRWTVVGIGLTLLSVIAAHIYPGNNPSSKQAGLGVGWLLWSGLSMVLKALFRCLQEPVPSAQLCYPPYHFILFQNTGLIGQTGDDPLLVCRFPKRWQ